MPTTYLIALHCIRTLWLAFATVWLISAFRTKRTVYRQPWRYVLTYLACGVVGGLIVSFLPRKWLIPPNPLLEAAGVMLCTWGVAFAVWARLHLGRNWSGLVSLKEDHQLIQSGPYRFVRHPIYTGLIVAVLGTVAALLPSLHGLVALAVLTTAFTLKYRHEEELLLRQFPEAYPAYKARVRAALIPFLL